MKTKNRVLGGKPVRNRCESGRPLLVRTGIRGGRLVDNRGETAPALRTGVRAGRLVANRCAGVLPVRSALRAGARARG